MGYYYDWTARPLYSNDPRGCIAPSVVTVDGQDVGPTLQAQSGPDGWAVVLARDASGAYVIEHWGLKTKTLKGHVRVNGEG